MIYLEKFISLAKDARLNSYSPYSNYKVGCALLTKSGKVFTGCNVENDGIMSICAERVAFSKAISEGEYDFEYIIVVGGDSSSEKLDKCLPCGYCRQFMSEFVEKDFKIYAYYDGKIDSYTIEQLLPEAFCF